jgi:osmoprotectant transport system substrate-binding protein
MRTRRVLSILPAAALAVTVAACGSSSSGGTPSPTGGSNSPGGGASGSLTVGAAGFTESNVLAQMYVDLLNKAGFDATVKQVSSSEIFQSSLEKGKIAVVPEYAATYANSLQTLQTGTQTPDAADPSIAVTMKHLKKYASQRGIEALQPSKAVDQNAFAVTKDFASQHHLTTLSDLGASGVPVKLGAPAECDTRSFCQPGLENTYGIKISGLGTYDFDSLAVKQALKNNKIQLGEVATTDATLDQLGLVVLTDDKNLQNADNLVPIVNSDQLAAHPEIATALNPLASVLTTADLGSLDNQIDGERKTVEEVATAYLTSKGLL